MIFTAAVSAETINTISGVEETALLNNLDYKSAVLDVLKAENALEGYIKLGSSSLSFSGSYGGGTGGTSDEDSDPAFSWQASASLPVIEQISLGAGVDRDMNGTFTLSLNPLSHSGSVEQTRLAYNKAVAAAEDKAEEISDKAVEAYLAWAAAESDYQVKTETTEVKQTLYEDEKVRFEKGDSDLDTVREKFTAWSEARTAENNARTSLQTAEAALFSLLNVDPSEVNVEMPGETELTEETERLKSETADADFSISGSYSVLAAESTADSLELQLKNTWIFEPQLSVSGTLTVSADSAVPELSATAALSFGLDDWNADEREELETELEISRQQTLQTISTEEMTLNRPLPQLKPLPSTMRLPGLNWNRRKNCLMKQNSFLNWETILKQSLRKHRCSMNSQKTIFFQPLQIIIQP